MKPGRSFSPLRQDEGAARSEVQAAGRVMPRLRKRPRCVFGRLDLLRAIAALCFLALSSLAQAGAAGAPTDALARWLGIKSDPLQGQSPVKAQLIAEKESIEPGTPFVVALHLKIDEHWHTYWKNPGESGLPTSIRWNLPPGFTAGPIQWPPPRRFTLPPLVNFGYDGEVLLMAELAPPVHLAVGQPVTLAARAEWIVCKNVCIPGAADVQITLPVRTQASRPDARWVDKFSATRAALPQPLTQWTATAYRSGGQIDLLLRPVGDQRADLSGLTFFPEVQDQIEPAAPQALYKTADSAYRLRLAAVPRAANANPLERLQGVLVLPDGWGPKAMKAVSIDVPLGGSPPSDITGTPVASGPSLAASAQRSGDLGLGLAVLFAFVGGLILNLMPCVFPVVSLKVLGFARHADHAPRAIRTHGLVFAAGVLTLFWLLAAAVIALRAAGTEIGWGFQLQSPTMVVLLALLFFGLGLNLSGVFDAGQLLPTRWAAWDARNPYGASFMNGALAVVVAAPCTIPFMGVAIGYAFSQPAVITFFVFTALALGMALPYVLLAWFPRWLERLPKPRRWMERLKQFLAFPLYATVVWLAWVLGAQSGFDSVIGLLVALVVLALALWLAGQASERWTRAAAFVVAVSAIPIALPRADSMKPPTPAPASANAPATAEVTWQPYSKARIAELQAAGKPVFVDFTAAWCVVCQVNKRIVLDTPEIQAAFAAKGVALVRADWTLRDAEITRALREFGRSGVPLYILYRPGKDPLVLPEVLRAKDVREALATF